MADRVQAVHYEKPPDRRRRFAGRVGMAVVTGLAVLGMSWLAARSDTGGAPTVSAAENDPVLAASSTTTTIAASTTTGTVAIAPATTAGVAPVTTVAIEPAPSVSTTTLGADDSPTLFDTTICGIGSIDRGEVPLDPQLARLWDSMVTGFISDWDPLVPPPIRDDWELASSGARALLIDLRAVDHDVSLLDLADPRYARDYPARARMEAWCDENHRGPPLDALIPG